MNIGKNLIELSISIAKEDNYNLLTLNTLASYTNVVNLYEKFGFTKNKVLPNRPGDIGYENFVEYIFEL